MKEWNDNFDAKTNVNGKIVTVGQQDFDDSTIWVREESGNIISCPMGMDEEGDIYFMYDNVKVYLRWL